MPKQNNNKLQKSWCHLDNQQRLSLEDFLALVREYLTIINIARKNIQNASLIFKTQRVIPQDQCNYIVDLAHAMNSPVQDLSHFLDQRTNLPVAILPLRHLLTTKLLSMKELLWIILVLAGSLHSVRKTDPKESTMTCYKLLQKLDILLQESDNIEQFAQVLSDQANFQEIRNKNILGRTSFPGDQEYSKGNNWNVYDISLYRKE